MTGLMRVLLPYLSRPTIGRGIRVTWLGRHVLVAGQRYQVAEARELAKAIDQAADNAEGISRGRG